VTLAPTGRVLKARWIGVHLVGGLPYPEPSGQSAKLVAALSREDFPADHFLIEPDGRFKISPRRGHTPSR
jgi:hypothetical protein